MILYFQKDVVNVKRKSIINQIKKKELAKSVKKTLYVIHTRKHSHVASHVRLNILGIKKGVLNDMACKQSNR